MSTCPHGKSGHCEQCPRCDVPYPLMTEFRCTHKPHGPERLHGYNGPFPPRPDNEEI